MSNCCLERWGLLVWTRVSTEQGRTGWLRAELGSPWALQDQQPPPKPTRGLPCCHTSPEDFTPTIVSSRLPEAQPGVERSPPLQLMALLGCGLLSDVSKGTR